MNKKWTVIVLFSSVLFLFYPSIYASPPGDLLRIKGSIENNSNLEKAGIQVGIFADSGHGATCAEPAYAPSDYLNDMALDMTAAPELDVDMAVSVGDLLFDHDTGVDGNPAECVGTFQQFLEHMNLPYFQTFGNHDIASYGRFGVDWSKNPYQLTKHVLNEIEINTPTYAVSKNNILFLFIGDKGSNYKLHNTQYEWLEYMTSRYPNQTTVIVSHQGIWGTTLSPRSGGSAEYTWYDNAPWWAEFFKNNNQIKIFVHGHNHEYSWVLKNEITSEKYVQGHGLGQREPYDIGHDVSFIEAPTHHKNQGPHNVNQFLLLNFTSDIIEWKLWKHDGNNIGFWNDPKALVQPSIHQWSQTTSYNSNAEDWYSFPVFLQDGETQLLDSKVFAEKITLEIIGSAKRELFANPELDYFSDWGGLGFVGFSGEDPSRTLNHDDGIMRVIGPRTIEFPSRFPDRRKWDGGKSGQMKNWLFHGSVPQLVPGAEYEITLTAKASPSAKFILKVKATDWTNKNQYEILSSSESTLVDVILDDELRTYKAKYLAPNDPNLWFITGELDFPDSANYEVHSFSIKRAGTSDISKNYKLGINKVLYNAAGDLSKFQNQQFVIFPEDIANSEGKIRFIANIDGSKSGMGRIIYKNPIFLRGGLIQINSFFDGEFDISVVTDVSSDKWKDLAMKLLPLDNEVNFSVDSSDFESRISPNGRIFGAEAFYSLPERMFENRPQLIAHWQAEQNTVDWTDNGNDGAFIERYKYAVGQNGHAFDFDLTNYVRIEDSAILDVDEITIAAWIYPRTWGGHANGLGRVVDKNQSALSRGFNFLINKNYSGLGHHNLAFRHQDGFVSSENNSISLNTWQHVTVTVNSSEINFYVNGLNKGIYAGTFILPKNANNLIVGGPSAEKFSNLRFDGLIDEIKIWNYALEKNEVIEENNDLSSVVRF